MKNNKWSLFKDLFKIQLNNYKKDIFNIFSGWIITTITLVIWLTFKETNMSSYKYDAFVLASAIGVSGIRNCLYNFIKTLHDFKISLFFDRLFYTKISKRFVFLTLIFFNQLMNLIVTFFLIAIAMCYKDQRELIGQVNWLMFITGYLMLLLMSNMLAFLIAFGVKNLEIALVIGNIYYFGAIYLLGLGIPYNVLATNQTVVIFTYLLPHRYMINIMGAGWINSPDFSIPEIEKGFGYNNVAFVPYLVSTIILIILIIILFIFFKRMFEYENRKFKRFKEAKKHIAAINQIKRAESIEELQEIIELHNLKIKKAKEK